jgi:hypothetical protein
MDSPEPNNHSPRRNSAAILLVVFCCLLSSARMIVKSPRISQLRPDDIGQRSDQRFAALKTALPAHGVIGYIGESGAAGLADYYLAQYALAPRILERSTDHALVVGNFAAAPAALPLSQLQLVKDFGNGVLLFSNKEAE